MYGEKICVGTRMAMRNTTESKRKEIKNESENGV